MADLVVVMDRGRIQQVGAADRDLPQPRQRLRRRLHRHHQSAAGLADGAGRAPSAPPIPGLALPAGRATALCRSGPRTCVSAPGEPRLPGRVDLRARPRRRASRPSSRPAAPAWSRCSPAARAARRCGSATPSRSRFARAAAWCSRHEPQAAEAAIADWHAAGLPGADAVVFFVVPFGIDDRGQLFGRDPAGFYTPDFVSRTTPASCRPSSAACSSSRSVLAVLVAALAWPRRFPSPRLLTRLPRRTQTLVLVAILSVLSLSEVIIGFAWSTLLSRTAGIGNLFVALGLMAKPEPDRRASSRSSPAWPTRPPLRGAGALPALLAPRPVAAQAARTMAPRRCAPSSTWSVPAPAQRRSWRR